MIKDSKEVSRQNRGKVKYSQIEKIIPAKTLINQIEDQTNRIVGILDLKPDENGNLDCETPLDRNKSHNFYLAMKILDSKVDYFMKYWSNFDSATMFSNGNLYNKIKTILEFYKRETSEKNNLNSPFFKFLEKTKPKDLVLQTLNNFLGDTTKYLKYKAPNEEKKYFTATVSTLDKLGKQLKEFEQKGGDLSYSEHQLIAKYNIALKALFEGINEQKSGFHSLNLLNIPKIINSLSQIQVQSSAVLDLKQTLTDYMEKNVKPTTRPPLSPTISKGSVIQFPSSRNESKSA